MKHANNLNELRFQLGFKTKLRHDITSDMI